MLTVVMTSMVVAFWAGTAWLHRTEIRTAELAPTGPYRLASGAGPIAVSQGESAQLTYRASWLLRGPTESPSADESSPEARNEIELACETRMPCRAAAGVELPADSVLRIESDGQDVSVDRFDGRLTVEVTGRGDVFLGPLAGLVAITTERGAVYGYELTAERVEITTDVGEVELVFAVAPAELIVRSGSEPVTIELPEGFYAVSVNSASSTVIGVGQAATADSTIQVQARGPVRINSRR